jgi:hypothetical protein
VYHKFLQRGTDLWVIWGHTQCRQHVVVEGFFYIYTLRPPRVRHFREVQISDGGRQAAKKIHQRGLGKQIAVDADAF